MVAALRRPGTPLAAFGAAVLGVLVLLVLLAPVLASFAPTDQLVGAPLAGPSGENWLGTDRFGRDVLSRVLHGGRQTLLLCGLTLVAVLTIGTVLGSAVAIGGRWADRFGRRVVDAFTAFPAVVIALAFVGLRGPSTGTVLFGVLIVWWAPFARLARSLVRSALAEPSAVTARALGASRTRLVLTEVWPRLRGPLLVVAATQGGELIGAIAGLSFLGFGAQPPSPEWGAMLNEGRANLIDAPHLVWVPAVAVLLTVLALTCVGEGLRDRLDPNRAVVRR